MPLYSAAELLSWRDHARSDTLIFKETARLCDLVTGTQIREDQYEPGPIISGRRHFAGAANDHFCRLRVVQFEDINDESENETHQKDGSSYREMRASRQPLVIPDALRQMMIAESQALARRQNEQSQPVNEIIARETIDITESGGSCAVRGHSPGISPTDDETEEEEDIMVLFLDKEPSTTDESHTREVGTSYNNLDTEGNIENLSARDGPSERGQSSWSPNLVSLSSSESDCSSDILDLTMDFKLKKTVLQQEKVNVCDLRQCETADTPRVLSHDENDRQADDDAQLRNVSDHDSSHCDVTPNNIPVNKSSTVDHIKEPLKCDHVELSESDLDEASIVISCQGTEPDESNMANHKTPCKTARLTSKKSASRLSPLAKEFCSLRDQLSVVSGTAIACGIHNETALRAICSDRLSSNKRIRATFTNPVIVNCISDTSSDYACFGSDERVEHEVHSQIFSAVDLESEVACSSHSSNTTAHKQGTHDDHDSKHISSHDLLERLGWGDAPSKPISWSENMPVEFMASHFKTGHIKSDRSSSSWRTRHTGSEQTGWQQLDEDLESIPERVAQWLANMPEL